MFGMGCFWGAERKFWELGDGVYVTAVGYAGGQTPNPTYEEVCTGRTGHNEVVFVVYDPKKISYQQLLKTFWENHDPTQGMRQGNDVGTQYRSGIYTFTPEQRREAEASKAMYEAALKTEALWCDHDRNPRRAGVLLRRGLSPAIPRQEPDGLLRARRHRRELSDRNGCRRSLIWRKVLSCVRGARAPLTFLRAVTAAVAQDAACVHQIRNGGRHEGTRTRDRIHHFQQPLADGAVLCRPGHQSLCADVQVRSHLVEFFLTARKASESDVILGVLSLVDITLTGTLILIVIFSGYENFVSKIDTSGHPDWPEWMSKVDFAGLKQKLLASIVAISAIQVLKAFMNLDQYPGTTRLGWLVGIHLVFVLSVLVLAIADRLGETKAH